MSGIEIPDKYLIHCSDSGKPGHRFTGDDRILICRACAGHFVVGEDDILLPQHQRLDLELLGVPPDFESSITNERLADELLQYICPAGEPWTGDTPEEDHGHTKCMWIGMAIKRLRAMP